MALNGSWDIETGIGARYDSRDLSEYYDSEYTLTFTNTSVDDTFGVSLYIKTGAGETYYPSPWWTLFPGWDAKVSLDLSSDLVSNLDDVREIGFSLIAWVGSDFGYADAIHVKVERTVPE